MALLDARKCGPLAGWAVDDVMRLLGNDQEYLVREDAALALGEIDAPQDAAVRALVEASGGPANEVGSVAARVIASKFGRAAVPVLLEVLREGGWRLEKEERPTRYHNALFALRLIGEGDHSVTVDLIDALAGNDDEAEGAAALLQYLGPPPAAAPGLINCLSASRWSGVRAQAAAALGDMGPMPEAVPGLITVLDDEMPWARAAAAEALGKMGAAARPAIPALEQAAQDKDDRAARAARDALEQIRSSQR